MKVVFAALAAFFMLSQLADARGIKGINCTERGCSNIQISRYSYVRKATHSHTHKYRTSRYSHNYAKHTYRTHRRAYVAHGGRTYRHRSQIARAVGDGRPRAWCGWYMRKIMGVADTAYNLARNWAHWGRPASPGIGIIVVWPHHVGMIAGRTQDGRWVVKSGNDGGGVRERPRSIAGAIAFRSG